MNSKSKEPTSVHFFNAMAASIVAVILTICLLTYGIKNNPLITLLVGGGIAAAYCGWVFVKLFIIKLYADKHDKCMTNYID